MRIHDRGDGRRVRGTQSLHTNSFDEAIAAHGAPLRIARNTQLIIQEETHITNVVDPWAGSYMMETLTQQMADTASTIIEEVEAQGGMTKAVASGWAKLKIEASAADKQAQIDAGKDVIVGVNKYKLDKEEMVDIREVDNHKVREGQIARLAKIRATRDGSAVEAALGALAEREDWFEQPARSHDPSNAPARHGGRSQRRAGAGIRAPPRRHQKVTGCMQPLTIVPPAGKLQSEIAEFGEQHGRRRA